MFRYGYWSPFWAFFVTAPSFLSLILGFDPIFGYFGINVEAFLPFVHSLTMQWNHWHGVIFEWFTALLPFEVEYTAFERNVVIVATSLMLPVGLSALRNAGASPGSGFKKGTWENGIIGILIILAAVMFIYGLASDNTPTLPFEGLYTSSGVVNIGSIGGVVAAASFILGLFMLLAVYNRRIFIWLSSGLAFWSSLEFMYYIPALKPWMMAFAEFSKTLPQY